MQKGIFLAAVVLMVGCGGAVDQSVTQQLCTAGGGCCPGSPIVVDMAGDGIHLTSAEDGVVYTLRTGRFGLWAWTERSSDDAFLVLDVNGNGRIDDGSELFGDGAIQIASADPNGFMALAYYDRPEQGGNGDGAIDARDAVWSRLRLWRDADHDAYSAPSELTTLDKAGVHSFSLTAKPSTGVDAYGNEFRFSATIVADAPVSGVVSDVWLQQAPLPLGGRVLRDYTEWTCWAWGYAIQHDGPDGPNGPVTSSCDSPTTANDPLATTSEGRLSRLVARFAVDTSKTTALNRAHNIVFNAINYAWYDSNGVGRICSTTGFPTPDLYYAPPYDAQSAPIIEIRVKCFAQVITSGGGGC